MLRGEYPKCFWMGEVLSPFLRPVPYFNYRGLRVNAFQETFQMVLMVLRDWELSDARFPTNN